MQGVGWFRPQLRNRSESSPELRDLAKPLLIYLAESVFELRSHSPDETVFEPHLQSYFKICLSSPPASQALPPDPYSRCAVPRGGRPTRGRGGARCRR